MPDKIKILPPEAHPILSGQFWSYLPLGLLILVGLIWLTRQFLPRTTAKVSAVPANRQHLTNPSIHFPTPNWHEPLTPIVNRQFRNETVELDGKHFSDCRFENVTFVYNGTMPVQFTNCGRPPQLEYTLSTDNPIISVTQDLIHWLQVTSCATSAKIIRNLTNRDDRK